MINFCTLFDSNYLTRGLALYESLRSVCPSFNLYVFAFNKECHDYLSKKKLPGITVVSLPEFEDEALLKAKLTRSANEYCWTCTPSIILYCLEKFNLVSCIYVDADMIFYQDPGLLLGKMAVEDSILISEHRYSKEYDQSVSSGKYCVQFMFFKNDRQGMTALRWWRERCLEWCYARVEDGKFGDQKYLDDWLVRFKGVHVLKHIGGGVAPWNVQQFSIANKEESVLISEKATGKEDAIVFFHYHGLKFYNNRMVSLSGSLYELDKKVKELLYLPYVQKLQQIGDRLKQEGVLFNVDGARSEAPAKVAVWLQYIKERLALWKSGRISILHLKLFSFRKHYHFLNLELLKRNWHGKIN